MCVFEDIFCAERERKTPPSEKLPHSNDIKIYKKSREFDDI